MARRRKFPTGQAGPIRAVAYRRVSTSEQADSGAGLAAQQAAIEAEIDRRGWTLVEVFTDEAASGKSLVGREALREAIEAIESGEADVLVVSRLDRLSRSLVDFAGLLARAQKRGWNLVALDLGVDLSTSAGRFLAHVMGAAAEWERDVISQRTKEAMAAKKAAGVRLGRPRRVPDEVCRQIGALREQGLTWQAVADTLNELDISTFSGGRQWYPSTARNAALAFERERARSRSSCES